MNVKEAIEAAMRYEQEIRDLYGEEARRAVTPEAKRFFQMLSDDEQCHFDYLNDLLNQWETTGRLEIKPIPSDIPAIRDVNREVAPVREKLAEKDRGDLKQALSKALQAEMETSGFYRKLSEEIAGETKEIFANFLVIEENHVSAVQAELNALNKSGFFFDVREFEMVG